MMYAKMNRHTKNSICNNNIPLYNGNEGSNLSDIVKTDNNDNDYVVPENEIDIIEIISNSVPESARLPFLPSTDDPDKILNVTEILKETITDISGRSVPIFSYGPWPKMKRFENQLRPINCHICRCTTIKREEMKNHICRQRHIRRLKTDLDEKYFKPMKNFYDLNENKTAILFLINAGENIEEVTKTHEDRLIEHKKKDILEYTKICLELASNDKLYDLNEVNPILGLEYCIKLTKPNENNEYYCVLCAKFLEINNVNHFLDYVHQDKYIEKHFGELSQYCLNLLRENIDNKIYCKKKNREILVHFYRKKENQNGFRHISTVEKNVFIYFQDEYINKVNELSHYSASPNELSTNNVINKMVSNFIKRSLYMKPHFHRKQNIIKNCTENKNENNCTNDVKAKESQNLEEIKNKLISNEEFNGSSKEGIKQSVELNQLAEINNDELEKQLRNDHNKIVSQCENKNTNLSDGTKIIEPTKKNDIESEKNNEITNRKKTEIIGKINEMELNDFSSGDESPITKSPTEIILENNIETNCAEDEPLEFEKPENNAKAKESKIIIENVIVVKTADVGKLNIEKTVAEMDHNPNDTENNIQSIHEIVAEENKDVSLNSMTIDNIKHNISALNSVDLENLNYTNCVSNIKESSNLNSTNSQINLREMDKSLFLEEIISDNNKSLNATILADVADRKSISHSIVSADSKLENKNGENSTSDCYSKKFSFKDHLFDVYDKYTIIKDNKEIPILSYGPPTDKLSYKNLRILCHVCEVRMNPKISQINDHINGQKHKSKVKQGVFVNPIRCYYKTNDKNLKVFFDIYAGEHIEDETAISKKNLYSKPETPKKLINQKKIKKSEMKSRKKIKLMDKSENIIKLGKQKQSPINKNKRNSDYKKFRKEFPPKIIQKVLDLKIPFKNNHAVSIFSFGPRVSLTSARTINCHLCNYTVKTFTDLTHHIKKNYHQKQKNTIKWIDLKKSMHLFYKCENKITQYFEIWPGENIVKANLNDTRKINANQILSDDTDDNEIIYKNNLNQSIMGLEYGIKLKQNGQNSYCFCLLCKEYLILESSEYFNHFTSEKHQHNYINKHFASYKQQIYNKIPTDINDENILNAIFLNINLNIYKNIEENFGYRKMLTTTLKHFQQYYKFFTEEFDEKIIHYNDRINLILENEILDIIEDLIKPFSIIESIPKERSNELLYEPSPKRMKFDSISSNDSLNGNVQKSSINFISVLRLLSVVEDILGARLGSQVLEVLGKAALCEKKEGNVLKLTTNNKIYMLLLTINEKLKGLFQAQFIEPQKLSLVKRLLIELPIVIDIMDEDKRNLNLQTVTSTSNNNHPNPGDNLFWSFGNNIDLGISLLNNIDTNCVSLEQDK